MSFYEKLAAGYDEIFPLQEARVSFVKDRVTNGGRILDVGCATGALAVRLAREGFIVEGLDNDPAMIALASTRPNPGGARFFEGDMERLPDGDRDGLICFGNTLVHLDADGVDRFTRKAASSLAEGPLLIQVLNYDRIFRRGILELPLIETPTLRFYRRYERTDGEGLRFVVELEDKETGEASADTTVLHPASSDELSRLLSRAGFSKIELMGDFLGGAFEANSYHLVISARK